MNHLSNNKQTDQETDYRNNQDKYFPSVPPAQDCGIHINDGQAESLNINELQGEENTNKNPSKTVNSCSENDF